VVAVSLKNKRIETVLSSSDTSTQSQMEVARWPESR